MEKSQISLFSISYLIYMIVTEQLRPKGQIAKKKKKKNANKTEGKKKTKEILGPVYMEKSCPG